MSFTLRQTLACYDVARDCTRLYELCANEQSQGSIIEDVAAVGVLGSCLFSCEMVRASC